MKKTIAEIRAIATDEQKARLDAIISMTRGANLSDEQVIELYEGEKTVEQIRSEYTKPQDNTKPVNVEEIRQQADAATKARLDAILKSTRAAKQEDSFAIELFNSNKTIEECRQAIIEKFVKGDPQINSHVNMGADQADKVRAAMEGALGHRVGVVTELKPEFREFRGMSLLRMAEEFLMQSGVKTGGMSRREIAELALGLKQNRAMSTSDFPLILGNTVNRRLLGAYQLQPRTFMPFCSKGNASDFREMSRLKLSGMMDSFEEVKEGGEYKNSSFKESQEKYTVAKYGRKIMITWETLINDDLSAFDRIPAAIAAKAAQKQSDIVWAIITANKAMADGTALFHADHGNLAAAGAAITIASLSAARAAMRKMKGMEGDYINVIPEFLLVGPDKELEAYQFTSANYVPVSNATINPEFNRNLKPIVEPRLTGNQWYLSANPSLVDTIEYAFLDGEGELFTEQRVGFDVDGLEIKARMVFGAKAIDHRGLYKNPGA